MTVVIVSALLESKPPPSGQPLSKTIICTNIFLETLKGFRSYRQPAHRQRIPNLLIIQKCNPEKLDHNIVHRNSIRPNLNWVSGRARVFPATTKKIFFFIVSRSLLLSTTIL